MRSVGGRYLPQLPTQPETSALISVSAPAGHELSALRVVAYGDSLTAGFPSFEPYAQSMAETLVEGGLAVEVVSCGLCGLSAGEMLDATHERVARDHIGRRGEGIVELCRPRSGRRADLAIIMAGTNDLAHQRLPAGDIAQRVRGIHEACHAAGVRTVAVAIPDQGTRAYRSSPWPDRGEGRRRREVMARAAHDAAELSRAERRRLVNAAMATWTNEATPVADIEEVDSDKSAATPSLEALLAALDAEADDQDGDGEEEGVPGFERPKRPAGPERPEAFFNAGALLPHGPKTVRAGLWEKDGVHLTAAGSREFGRRLAFVLQPLVSRLRAARLADGGAMCSDEDGSTLSLDAYLNAFREEDELCEAGDDVSAEHFASTPHWEEGAAVVIQRAVRATLTPTRLCSGGRGLGVIAANHRPGHVCGTANCSVRRTYRPIDAIGDCNANLADASLGSSKAVETINGRPKGVSNGAAGDHCADVGSGGARASGNLEDASKTSCTAVPGHSGGVQVPVGPYARTLVDPPACRSEDDALQTSFIARSCDAANTGVCKGGGDDRQGDVAKDEEGRPCKHATGGGLFDFDALSEDEA